MSSYGPLARRYDALTRDVDYAAWARYIQRHFSRAGREIRSVVDLACGTGSLAVCLAGLGYDVTGVDLSPDMLALAADKCADLTPRPLLLCQDMSRLRLLAPADAVVCCLDSLNYVTRPAAVRRTFSRVRESLAPGGLFLFDVRSPDMLRSMDGRICLDETEDTYCVWRGEFSRRRNILTYCMDLFCDAGGAWTREEELHEEYAYDPDELEAWLREAGFERVRRFGNLVLRPPRAGEERIFFVAGKPPDAPAPINRGS